MSSEPDRLSPALEQVLGNFGGILRRVCWRYRLSGAEVDELVQEVRIRLWRAHGSLDHADEQIAGIPASYLHRTALSAAIDLLRRRRARRADRMVPIDDEPDSLPEGPGPEQTLAPARSLESHSRVRRTSDALWRRHGHVEGHAARGSDQIRPRSRPSRATPGR